MNMFLSSYVYVKDDLKKEQRSTSFNHHYDGGQLVAQGSESKHHIYSYVHVYVLTSLKFLYHVILLLHGYKKLQYNFGQNQVIRRN